MPLEFDDPDGDGGLCPATDRFGDRFGAPKAPWWRPASKTARIFLSVAAILVLGAFTTAGLMLKHSLERDSRFRIAGSGNIQATGLTEVSRAEMLPVFGEDIGRNVFFVPLNERRRQLEQIPWIERAMVIRLLPDQIRVEVAERQPVAFTRHGQQIGLVDANGVLLAMAPATMAKHHYSFPVLTGIDPGDSAESRKTRVAVYQRLMSELDAGGKRNSEQISEIDLTDPEDARVVMPEQGADILAHLGDDRFFERYQRYKAHIAEWRQQYPHLASVDLRYDNQVVLQMASGKETSETAGGDPATGSPVAPAGDAKATGAKENAEAKPSAGAPHSGAATSAKPVVKKGKPAPDKKQAAVPQKRAAAQSSTRRNSAATARPAAAATPGSKSRSLGAPAVTVAKGG